MREPIDWNETEEYLQQVESAYAECGYSGQLVTVTQIVPARDRFNRGERTESLHRDIMDISM